MIGILDSYEWENAFCFAREPTSVPPGTEYDCRPILREDVKTIAWYADGDNEGPNWLIGGELTDGRWFFLSAGCDYTGWDCRAWGNAYIARSRSEIERWAMGDGDRDRLGVALEGDTPREEADGGWWR